MINGEIRIDIYHTIKGERYLVITTLFFATNAESTGFLIELLVFEFGKDVSIYGGTVGTGVEEEIEFLIVLIDGDDGHIGEVVASTKGDRFEALTYRREMGSER